MVYSMDMRFLVGLPHAVSGLLLLTSMSNHSAAQSRLTANQGARSSNEIACTRASIATTPHDWHNILTIFAKARTAVQLRKLPVAQSIQLAPSSHASAFVYQRRSIRLSEPLLETLQQDDQLAFAISQEMAHIALGHASDSSDAAEFAADAFAASLMAQIGMDSCASATALEALERREPLYRKPLLLRAHQLRKTVLVNCPLSAAHIASAARISDDAPGATSRPFRDLASSERG